MDIEKQVANYNAKLNILGIKPVLDIRYIDDRAIIKSIELPRVDQYSYDIVIPNFVTAIDRRAIKFGMESCNLNLIDMKYIKYFGSEAISTNYGYSIEINEELVLDKTIDMSNDSFNGVNFNTLILKDNICMFKRNIIDNLIIDNSYTGDLMYQDAHYIDCNEHQLLRYLNNCLHQMSFSFSSTLEVFYKIINSTRENPRINSTSRDKMYELLMKTLEKSNVFIDKTYIRKGDMPKFKKLLQDFDNIINSLQIKED